MVRNAAGFREVPASALAAGDCVVVLPGDCVPADGVVTAGRSSVDEATFTGEPLPVGKSAGECCCDVHSLWRLHALDCARVAVERVSDCCEKEGSTLYYCWQLARWAATLPAAEHSACY